MANPFQSLLPALKPKHATVVQSGTEKSGIPSYKKGTKFVPKTGLAKLERGEAVLTKSQAKKYRKGKSSSAGRVLGSGKKKPTKTQKLIRKAGHELKVNPPKILAKTAAKEGSEAANKQRVAIMLSKARKAGADIPEK